MAFYAKFINWDNDKAVTYEHCGKPCRDTINTSCICEIYNQYKQVPIGYQLVTQLGQVQYDYVKYKILPCLEKYSMLNGGTLITLSYKNNILIEHKPI